MQRKTELEADMGQHKEGNANQEEIGREDVVSNKKEQRSVHEEGPQGGDDPASVSRDGGVDCETGTQVLIKV